MILGYEEAWRFLDDLQFFKIKLGLESMHYFLEKLDRPQDKLKCIHIGGTNGKGSVGATLLAILSKAGYRTGFYTSPHLSSVRERFQINGEYMSRDEFARIASQICGVLNGGQITYFEFTTTMALLWFLERGVDFAIMEVGMGGRLDATNVVSPLLSIITNVALDHQMYLGDTLEAIAFEKAGIIKEGAPVVCGVTDPKCLPVMEKTCGERKTDLLLAGRDFFHQTGGDGTMAYAARRYNGESCLQNLRLRLMGEHQKANTALALAAVDLLREKGYAVPEEAVRQGIATVSWPGRMELLTIPAPLPALFGGATNEPCHAATWDHPRHVLMDGAHNPAGVESLCAALASDFSRFKNIIFLYGAMSDKDIHASLALISPLASMIFLTKPRGERSATPRQLLDALPPEFNGKARCEPDVNAALQQCFRAASGEDLICVTGSLYLIGEIRRALVGDIAA